MAIKSSAFPYRRGSDASDPDFFDIPDESIPRVLKRQLRRKRTWIILALLFLFIQWLRLEGPPPPALPHIRYDLVDWSRYAYTQYATSETYLCNSVILFETLHRLGSRADRVLFYPEDWGNAGGSSDRTRQLLNLAKKDYNVLLMPVSINGIKAEASGELRVQQRSGKYHAHT